MIAKLQARNQQLQSPSSSSQLNPSKETPLLSFFATLQRNQFCKMQMYKISHIREQSCKTVQLPQGMNQQLTNLETTPARKTDDDNNNNKNSRKTFNQLWYMEKNVMNQKETRTEQREKKKKEKDEDEEDEEEDKKTLLKSVS